MKPSGIEWIGDIPDEWGTKPIKYLCSIVQGATPDTSSLDYWDGEIPWVTPADMSDEGELHAPSKFITKKGYDSCTTTMVPVGSVVISSRAPIGKIGYVSIPICTNQGCKTLVGHILNHRYTYYAAIAAKSEFIRSGRGTTFMELSSDGLGQVSFPVPPRREQESIATYLDCTINEANKAYELLDRQIALLERYKSSLIHEAVTKGLDRDVPTRPSGVEWIGEIPEHWKTKRVKYVLDFLDYLRAPIEASQRSKDGKTLYPYYGASGIIDEIDDYNVEGPALLIGEDGANLVLRHLPLVYFADGKYWVNNHAHILRPKGGCMRFFFYALEACDYSQYITGSAQPKLSQGNLSLVRTPVPPIHEQFEIASFLDDRCSRIDRILDLKRRQVDVLRRRRQSLIYEYVTGKRRVDQEA
ncbi:restriction endonuclease subunit S [Olsenella sp. YH-ols2221]|uniref:restriction endonuclease subunit S n=1 Tax=Olsenella kribbiana TaxID=3115221 RepID=UPI002EDAFE4A